MSWRLTVKWFGIPKRGTTYGGTAYDGLWWQDTRGNLEDTRGWWQDRSRICRQWLWDTRYPAGGLRRVKVAACVQRWVCGDQPDPPVPKEYLWGAKLGKHAHVGGHCRHQRTAQVLASVAAWFLRCGFRVGLLTEIDNLGDA